MLLTTRDGKLLGSNRGAWPDGDVPAPLADLRQDRRLASALVRLDDGTTPASRLVSAADLGIAADSAVAWPLIVLQAPLLAGSQGEMRIVIAAPLEDFNGSVRELRNRILLFSGLLLLLLLPPTHIARGACHAPSPCWPRKPADSRLGFQRHRAAEFRDPRIRGLGRRVRDHEGKSGRAHPPPSRIPRTRLARLIDIASRCRPSATPAC
ncbi:MAG: hypothetical protein WDO24_14665 [Pseudomonadota bacterium]